MTTVRNNELELHTATQTQLKDLVFGGKGKKPIEMYNIILLMYIFNINSHREKKRSLRLSREEWIRGVAKTRCSELSSEILCLFIFPQDQASLKTFILSEKNQIFCDFINQNNLILYRNLFPSTRTARLEFHIHTFVKTVFLNKISVLSLEGILPSF